MRLSIFVWRLAMWTGVAERRYRVPLRAAVGHVGVKNHLSKVLRGGEHLLHSCGE